MKLTKIDIIWDGCKKQDRRAQSDLYQHFSARMFSVCLRYADDRSEAEDIMQNAFIKVFTRHHLYDGKGSLEGWVRRIMVNTAIEYHRKRKVVYLDLQQEGSPAMAMRSDLHTDRTGYTDLMQLVNELPVNYRMVFNLYAIEGFTHREIAETLLTTETNSKTLLSRARSWLKDRLENMDKEPGKDGKNNNLKNG